jgi:hypothetical protein
MAGDEMSITRRAFIRGGALGLVSFGLDPLFLSRAAYAVGPRACPHLPAAERWYASFSAARWMASA